ncbi:MAG: hypothetical protein LH603_01155 [Pseudonocardia sp.]|nr:hypothetical protein [Pseudonocardia sp.]
MISPTRRLLVAVIAAGLASLTACGGAAPAPAPQAAAAAEDTAVRGGSHGSAHGPGSPIELWAVQTSALGVTVTDASGHLLYRSDLDGNAPPTSNCVGPCTEVWEPFVAVEGQEPTLLGVKPKTLGAIVRADGATQYTLGGWPIYRRVGEQAGLLDAGANGTDGVWFAVTPQGEKAGA